MNNKPGLRLRRAWARASRLCCASARDGRGSGGVELGIGAFVVIAVAALAADFYALTKTSVASGRMAAAMADYVSRETTPSGDEMVDLGQYLHDRELHAPAHLVFVVSAVQQPGGGNPVTPLWVDSTIRFGDDQETSDLADECVDHGKRGWQQSLLGLDGTPATETLPQNTVVIIVEVCVKPTLQGMLTSEFTTGYIYRLHVLPVRDKSQRAPASPVYSQHDNGTDMAARWGDEPFGSSAHAAWGRMRFPASAGVA